MGKRRNPSPACASSGASFRIRHGGCEIEFVRGKDAPDKIVVEYDDDGRVKKITLPKSHERKLVGNGLRGLSAGEAFTFLVNAALLLYEKQEAKKKGRRSA